MDTLDDVSVGNYERPQRPAAKPLRRNVLFMVGCELVIAVAVIAHAFYDPTSLEAHFGIIGGIAGHIAAKARDIISLDDAPFDANQAAHVERMRQAELDHEYRNGQNSAMAALINKVGSSS